MRNDLKPREKEIHNYYINFNANQEDYENTVQYFSSIGFETKYVYESVLGDLYYSIMVKDKFLIKVLEDYPYDGVRIESETELPENILKGLSIIKHFTWAEQDWPKPGF